MSEVRGHKLEMILMPFFPDPDYRGICECHDVDYDGDVAIITGEFRGSSEEEVLDSYEDHLDTVRGSTG